MDIAADLAARLKDQRAAFLKSPYPSAQQRREHLDRLLAALLAHQDELIAVVDKDFGGRSHQETVLAELFTSIGALRFARKHVEEWMARRRGSVSLPMQPARAWVMPQPVGVVGIISPWNYPVSLAFTPIAGALAAGNRILLKPSEHTPATAELLARLVGEAFPADHVAVVTGDAAVGRAFASLPFDHLLFTGSTSVGREVMRAAAGNLTPVTLELGGKSPAIIAEDADIKRTAADIAYGKLLNAGQTCIAPDYVLVPHRQMRGFLDACVEAAKRYYPEETASPDYTAIIHERHVARIEGYVEEARARGVEVIPLFSAPANGRKLPPVLLVDPPDDLTVMRDEIFGPVLPVEPYTGLEEAIAYINARPRPLALYLFTHKRRVMDEVLKRTVSGGVTVNDTLMHVAVEDLPFGGTGASGIGQYHGRAGFDTFSKLKPVFHRSWQGATALIRPPTKKIHALLRKFLIRG
ncbi:MAG: coniferyl aldehyde dehydrogenase [Acidobacteria bacterium]|nr:coniferyl aldehyde dehydrogenase [Acidobacteriota bacterium]